MRELQAAATGNGAGTGFSTEYGTALLGENEITSSSHSARERKRRFWWWQDSNLRSQQQTTESKWFSLASSQRHHEASTRILDRSAAWNQSNGQWRIFRANRSRTLYTSDWYHTVINKPLYWLCMVFFLVYLIVIIVFAFGFWTFSDHCSLDIYTFRAAFYFSLETIMTIGYGLPAAMDDQPYFNECDSALLLILFESIIGIFCDALCLGVVFGRLSRGQTRATTVIFSDFAVIRRIRGKLHLMFQVVEMRKHQLVEAHVRCYLITRHKGSSSPNIFFRTDTMRLSKPDDELGSLLLMCLPSVVVHDIDEWSPLRYIMREYNKQSFDQSPKGGNQVNSEMRMENQNSNSLRKRGVFHNPSKTYEFPDVLQREIDVRNGNREVKEELENPDTMGKRNQSYAIDGDGEIDSDEEENALRKAMAETKAEIIVLIEGIDATTSYTIQARHSYTSSDILFHHDFVPCVSELPSGGAVLDFAKFHDVIPVHGKDKDLPSKQLFSCS